MAIVQVNVAGYYDSEFPEASTISVLGAGVSPGNPAVLVPGDTLRINFTSGGGSITVSGFSTTYWTVGSNLTMLSGGNGSRVSKTGVNIEGTLIVIWDTLRGAQVDTSISFRIGTPADTTPDTPSFTTRTQLSRNTLYSSNTITVSGLSSGVSIPCSISGGNGAYFRKNGVATNLTSTTVVNGNTIQLFNTTNNANYSTSSCTLNMNGVTANWLIRTADVVPASVDIGPNITGAGLSAVYNSAALTISGVDVAVTASVSGGGAYLRKNSGATNLTSVSVSSGDVIRVFMTSPSGYQQTVSTTLTVGESSRVWTISTPSIDPQTGTKISIGVSGAPLSLSQVVDFFGGFWRSTKPTNMAAYVKGGALVPNITENAAIASGTGLALSQFINARTSMYWTVDRIPPFYWYVDSYYNTGAVELLVSIRHYLGFGNIGWNCEFRYVVNSGGVGLRSGMSTYNKDNGDLWLWVSVLPNQDSGSYVGEITCYARNRYNPSVEFSIAMDYYIEIYNSNL